MHVPTPTPRLLSLASLLLAIGRVEVIKGGGTQQAKDAVQQQLGARNDASSCPPNDRHQGSVDDSSASLGPQGSVSISPTTRSAKSNNYTNHHNNNNAVKNVNEHKEVKTNILRFYQQDRNGSGDGAAAAAAAAAKTAFASASASASNLNAPGAAATALTPVPATPAPPAGGAKSGANNQDFHRPQPCPAVSAGAGSSSAAGGRCSTTGRRRRRRRGEKGGDLPGEDVRRLLLRAMVGYDWVDEFNSKDVRVRGAFTEQDVVVLEVRGPEDALQKTARLEKKEDVHIAGLGTKRQKVTSR